MILLPIDGQQFGRLTALSRCENIGPHVAYLCRCACGAEVKIRAHSLRRGETTSCGCFRKDKLAQLRTTHGLTNTPTWNSWAAMMARCYNTNHRQHKDYAGRGITVCDRWHKVENFYADMGERPPGTTIDRKNNDGIYEPGNCQWATRAEQNRNKRNSKGT